MDSSPNFIGWEPTTLPASNCLQIMVCSCIIPSKSVFAANFILLMRNSNHARSLWSLLSEIQDHDRFPELSESVSTSLLDQKNSDNTKKATKVTLNVFTEAKAAYGVMLLKQV